MVVFLSSCNSSTSKNKHVIIGADGKAEDITYEKILLPEAGKIDKEEAARIKAGMDQYVTQFLVPAGYNGGLLVAWKGNIIYENYIGNKLINGVSTPIGDTDAIHVASTSKTFTAHIILLLYQQGLLRLTDSIQKFIPEFPYNNITILNLLTHRSGLPKYDYFMEEKNAKMGRMVNNDDVINYMITKKPAIYLAPNKGFQYCNTNYMLLASIAEKVSGKPFPKLMKQEIFGPLGMERSYVATIADTLRNIMSFNRNGTIYNYTELDGTYGDKNVYTTAKDMLKWHTYLQHKNKLRKTLLDSCYIGYSNEKPGMRNYGLGFRMFNMPNNKQIIFHNGYWHGNNSSFTRLLDEDVVIIGTGNKLCRQTYGIMSFTGFFGDYLGFEKELETEKAAADSAKMDPQQLKLNKFIKEQIKPKLLPADSLKFRLDSLRKDSILRWRKDSLLKAKKGKKDSL